MNQFIVHLGFGAQSGAFGGLHDPSEGFFHLVGFRVPHVVIYLGKGRHHVGGLPAGGNGVVHARVGMHMLPHQVDHVVHGLYPIQGRPAQFGRPGRVGRLPVEPELSRLQGE